MLSNMPLSQNDSLERHNIPLEKLVYSAISKDASDARLISSADITIRNELARYCIEPHKCPNYGLAPSCPPHVSGPAGFRELITNHPQAIAVKIDVSTKVLMSDERRDFYQRLHEVVAGVEHEAIEMGYTESKAFAGGSCKTIFCYGHEKCNQLFGTGKCLYPQTARPSMSGFGVDVAALMKTCGWSTAFVTHEIGGDKNKMSWIAGLVLIG